MEQESHCGLSAAAEAVAADGEAEGGGGGRLVSNLSIFSKCLRAFRMLTSVAADAGEGNVFTVTRYSVHSTQIHHNSVK